MKTFTKLLVLSDSARYIYRDLALVHAEETAPAGLAGPRITPNAEKMPELSPNSSKDKGSYHVSFIPRDVLRTSGGLVCGGFFGGSERTVVNSFRISRSQYLSGFDIMEQIKHIFSDVPFTDKDRVMEILQAEGVS